jgi:hypothetical protein
MSETDVQTFDDVKTFFESSTPTTSDEALHFCTSVVHSMGNIKRLVWKLEVHDDLQSRQAYAEMISEILRSIVRDAADLERTISIIGDANFPTSDLSAVNELIRNVLLTTSSPTLAKSAANLRNQLAPHFKKAGI